MYVDLLLAKNLVEKVGGRAFGVISEPVSVEDLLTLKDFSPSQEIFQEPTESEQKAAKEKQLVRPRSSL